jgi:hypothetical protein
MLKYYYKKLNGGYYFSPTQKEGYSEIEFTEEYLNINNDVAFYEKKCYNKFLETRQLTKECTRYNERIQLLPFGHKDYNKKFEEYLTHKRANPEIYTDTYEEADLPTRAMYKGFIPRNYYYSSKNNWFGCSAAAYPNHSSDHELYRDNKAIYLSLQGLLGLVLIPNDIIELPETWKTIALFENGLPVYVSHEGIFPELEFFENFIS